MILLSALFAALSIAAAVAYWHAGQSGWAMVWAFGGGWWASNTGRRVRWWLQEWRAARKGGR